MNLAKKQKGSPGNIDFTKKHKCYYSDDIDKNNDKNPIIANFDTINEFCHIIGRDEDNLYCADGFCFPYESSEMNHGDAVYTVCNIFEFDAMSDGAPASISEDSEDDLYLYCRDKRDISIHKVFKSTERREIYIIPFGGCSLEGVDIINTLINIEIQRHKCRNTKDAD